MKKLFLLLLAVMLLTACGQDIENDQEAVYVNITAEEAKQIMDIEEGYIILDVRTQEEYDQGHIPGAIVMLSIRICSSRFPMQARRIWRKQCWMLTARNSPRPSLRAWMVVGIVRMVEFCPLRCSHFAGSSIWR